MCYKADLLVAEEVSRQQIVLSDNTDHFAQHCWQPRTSDIRHVDNVRDPQSSFIMAQISCSRDGIYP